MRSRITLEVLQEVAEAARKRAHQAAALARCQGGAVSPALLPWNYS